MEKNRDYDIGWGSNVIKKMFRIMKGFICFLILGLSTVSASTFSQVRVSIDMKNATLKEVFKEITKVTGYEFVYSNNEVESVGKISLHVENKDLRDVLAECLKGTQLWYMIENQLVVVSPKLTNPKVVQDNKSTIVSGKVMDQDKNPLPGVTILLKGTTTGVVTNVDGVFFIMVPDTTANVEFIISFVGMKTKTVNLKNRPKTGDWVITMEEDLLEMEEVVVTTGYQNLKKSQIAGSVSVVKAEKVKIGGVPSIENMLQGQITGMNVIINSGDPGASAKIRIRGTSSILGNRAPLWVLDGVILTEDDMGEISTTDLNGDDAAYLVGNAISGINPNDIESITVLKDASATAIYGVQAANGVIVVTTKQGQTGPPKLSYSGSYAINQRMAYSDLERMNATERLQLSKEIIEDNSYYSSMPVDYGYEGLYIDWLARKITYDEFAEGVQKLADMNTDWYDILFRNSFTHAHSLSLSGGKEGTRYYASLGYDDTQSTAIKNYSRRFTATAKVNSWLLKDKLYMNFQVNASTKNTLGFHSSVNPNTYAYNTSRAIPCYNDDGSLFFYDMYKSTYSSYGNVVYYNILNEMGETGQSGRVNQLSSQLNLEWNIWRGIKYKLQLSYQNSHSMKKSWATEDSYYVTNIRGYDLDFYETYVPPTEDDKSKAEIKDGSQIPSGGIYAKNTSQTDTYTVQNSIEFNHVFKEDHVVNLMAVSEIRQIKTDGLSATYYGWLPERGETFSPAITTGYTNLLATGALNPTLDKSTKNYVSWIFTGSYSYRDKLLLNGNVRMDGSNQFGSNPKYRFLPIWSISGKYTLSKENFLKDSDIISYLAFRASYGIQGNVDGGTSPDLVLKIGSQNSITGHNESTVAYLPNPDLRWEKTESFNLGIDLALFSDRISVVADVYKKRGTDMIMNKNVSQSNGVQTVKINAGKVDNSGVEVGFRFVPFRTKDWDTALEINYSYNRNKLIDANEALVTNEDKLAGNGQVVGEALGTLYSYDYVGLDPESGYPVFRDMYGETTHENDNGKIIPNYTLWSDEVNLVKSAVMTAPSQGGINLSVGWKGLRLSGSFTYQFGGVNRLSGIYGSNSNRVYDPMSNVSKEYTKRWRKSGDEAKTDIPVLYNSRVFNKLSLRTYMTGKTETKGTTMYDKSNVRVAKTDFLKMRSLSLNYVIPTKFISKWRLDQCTIGLQATNLFTWADKRWEGSDPEAAFATSPLTRTYTLNLNITF